MRWGAGGPSIGNDRVPRTTRFLAHQTGLHSPSPPSFFNLIRVTMSTSDPPPPPTGPRPASPRSPRPGAAPTGVPTVGPGDLPTAFMGPQGPPPRPNIGSMLFLTAFFFFMSGGNNVAQAPVQIGPDGELVHRVTQLELAGTLVDEYQGFLNGSGNWSEVSQLCSSGRHLCITRGAVRRECASSSCQPAAPVLQATSLIPPQYVHDPYHTFFTNISGFYREGRLHPQPLLRHRADSRTTFFEDVHVPDLNTTSWNETQASELRGEFPWATLVKWDMNLKERIPKFNFSSTDSMELDNHGHDHPSAVSGEARKPDWIWAKGAATLTAADESTVEYNFYGLHHVPNGTYNLYGLPDGMRMDIRDIPRLWPEHANVTRGIILAELEAELKVQQDNLYLSEVRPDGK